MMSPLLLLFRGQLVFEDCSCHLWNVDDLKSQSICVLISFTHFSSKLVLGRAQKSSGSGLAFQPTFGLGLDRACKFLQTSGSGPSGFTFEVRAFGLIGLGLKFYYQGDF